MGGAISRYEKNDEYLQVVLLGIDNAGKSTVLKQIQLNHGKGFTQRELTRYKHAIFAHTFNTLQHILLLIDEEYEEIPLEYSLNKIFMDRIMRAPPSDYDVEELPFRLEIMMLWKEESFREAARAVFKDQV